MQADVTPEEVLRLREPTSSFLCPLSANIYNIDFLSFTISDYDTKKVIFEVNREKPPPIDFSSFDEESLRKIRYKFSEDVLRLPAIRTQLRFSVGNVEVPNFRMIERHYFRDQLIKSYDFTFGFCIPNSVNTWDAVYAVPPLDNRLVDEMVNNPHSTQSDSFYFVNDRLVMHNKASYSYIVEDRAQSKRSYDVLNPEKPSKAAARRALSMRTTPAGPRNRTTTTELMAPSPPRCCGCPVSLGPRRTDRSNFLPASWGAGRIGPPVPVSLSTLPLSSPSLGAR